jgi:hypothetical protein
MAKDQDREWLGDWSEEAILAMLECDARDPATWPEEARKPRFCDPATPLWEELGCSNAKALRECVIEEAINRRAYREIQWAEALLAAAMWATPEGPAYRLLWKLSDAMGDAFVAIEDAGAKVAPHIARALPDNLLERIVAEALDEAKEEASEPASELQGELGAPCCFALALGGQRA